MDRNDYSDSEIIDCLRKRQSYVVHYLSDRYLPMIRLMVTRMGGSSEDARDIFQEGLMIMLEKIDDPGFTLTCHFKTYLYSICENLWKSAVVKRQSAAHYFSRRVDEDDEKDFGETIDNRLHEEIFREAYDSLGEVSRNILKMYWEELAPQEIADRLGYTYGYVRKKKCEAQAELVEKVKAHPDYQKLVSPA
jgi:RNA polymerase sigma factor (sigma-70 family)